MNIKYPELLQRYKEQEKPKAGHWTFLSRVNKYWYTKEQAIKKETFLWKHLIKGAIDETWRQCSVCNEYKDRSMYNKSVHWINNKMNLCRACCKIKKAVYRSWSGKAKDSEYKKRSRTFFIGEKILIHGDSIDMREVVKKEPKKSYVIQSVTTKLYSRIDPCHKNPNFKKFYRLEA